MYSFPATLLTYFIFGEYNGGTTLFCKGVDEDEYAATEALNREPGKLRTSRGRAAENDFRAGWGKGRKAE